MLAASLTATFYVLSVALAVVAPSPVVAAAGRYDEQRTPADLRNIAVLDSVGELNVADDSRLDGLTHTGNGVDEEEPEVLDDSSPVASMLDETKRAWGKTNMALWGKRHATFSNADDDESIEKRKWSQKNMALWGKRSGNDDYFRFPAAGRYPQVSAAAEKRKWGQKNMALWGR